ncbi:MAG: peptidoglycan DD-metalloendopeptidase family protein [Alistipes sp.]|nr:peptidoglycan DD-metalloendopeptidase family protein [Alistipes sp.]
MTLLAMIPFTSCRNRTDNNSEKGEEGQNMLYGICIDDYTAEQGTVGNGQTLGSILNRYGVSAAAVDRLDRAARDIFPLRKIRAGNAYTAFLAPDSAGLHLDYLVYEQSVTDYVVFGFRNDSVTVTTGQRPVTLRRMKRTAQIESSLWYAIMKEGLPYSLAAELEEVYQWTVDFFSVQKGDAFTVIYDEKFIDTLPVGIDRIWGAKFTHAGKDIYAIPFIQDGRLRYWEYDGGSLRKQMLKAPLKFTRISSKFSNARYHPVLKRYRPHHGVDYAAPKGTPVHAVADGIVVNKGWDSKGGGNYIKIKHPNNMTTGYLHLSGFAKGLAQGKHVSQGELIGYVGSTGVSTGPHLDFRVWKGSTPIDPLKIPQEPAEPISKANRAAFESVRDRIVAELEGDIDDSQRVTQLDSVIVATATDATERQ